METGFVSHPLRDQVLHLRRLGSAHSLHRGQAHLEAGAPVRPVARRDGAAQRAPGVRAFGVQLYLPVDVYQKTERSVKYGMLFLVLTFLAFFLFEVFSPVSLHPMHYLLVGSALCLFYRLVLADEGGAGDGRSVRATAP